MLVETKGFGSGLDHAKDQVSRYTKSFPECGLFVTTNGYIYKTYTKGEEGWQEQQPPTAYLNLLSPRRGCVRYPVARGASEVLKMLMPQQYGTD